MNICLLGLSGSGKTCYLYTMSHVLANGISINGHTISATSTDRRQQLRLNRGIEQMANGIWPDGSLYQGRSTALECRMSLFEITEGQEQTK